MNKSLFTAFVMAMSLLLGQFAFAGGCMYDHDMKGVLSSLKLDDKQKMGIENMLKQAKVSLKDQWNTLHGLQQQISDMVLSSDMDMTKLNGLIDQRSKVMAEVMRARIDMKHQMFMMLNPEQQKMFKNMMQERHEAFMKKIESCKKQAA